jgi:hypothetical protein
LLKVEASRINEFILKNNLSFNSIHIGCANLLDEVLIENNGELNKSNTNLYFCPEAYNKAKVVNLRVNTFEIGNLGSYSEFSLEDIWVDKIILTNCIDKNVNIKVNNLRPLASVKSQLQLMNSQIKSNVFLNDKESILNLSVDLDNTSTVYL